MKSELKWKTAVDKALQFFQKQLGGAGKSLLLFPDNIEARFQPRVQRTKTQLACFERIRQVIERYRIADAGFNHKGGIVKEIIGGYNV